MVRRKRSMRINSRVDLFSGRSLCIRTPVDELKGNCACYTEKEDSNRTWILTNAGIYVDM